MRADPTSPLGHACGTTVGQVCESSMFGDGEHVTITPGTRAQVEQLPVGPTPAGLYTDRCRVCMLDRRGDIYEDAVCMGMTWDEMIAHINSEGHFNRAEDGRLDLHVQLNMERDRAQRASPIGALHGALDRAMAGDGGMTPSSAMLKGRSTPATSIVTDLDTTAPAPEVRCVDHETR